MHPEIVAVLNDLDQECSVTPITLRNAERVLNYIEDIILERTGKFEVTPAESLYLLWNIADWELHIECLKNGRILYTFRKSGYGKACGSLGIGEFIPYLERYLLTGIC